MAAAMESGTGHSMAVPDAGVPQSTPQIAEHGLEALKDISFGSLAGTMGKIVEYPFDTVKVRLQSQPDHLPLKYTGPLDCFKQSIQQDGVRGLYRGLGAPMLGAAAETASLFFTYRLSQDLLWMTIFRRSTEEKLPLSALVLAGAMSGSVTSLVLTPIELVKCRIQVPVQGSGVARPKGILAVTLEIWRREGFVGFWRGQMGTLVRETGGGAAWFGSYETLSLFFRSRLQDPANDSLPIWQRLVSGAAAGMSYNFILYPADTIKSKIQTSDFGQTGMTFFGVGKDIWRAHGIKGFYRGCGITVARSAPSSALIFTIYESLRNAFG